MSAVLTEEQRQRLEEHFESHGPHHGPWDPQGHLTRLQEGLDLTDEQVAELRTIFEEQREKLQVLRESVPEDREAFQELRAEAHERMSAVLTEEQQQRLEELTRSHAGSHGPRGASHRGS